MNTRGDQIVVYFLYQCLSCIRDSVDHFLPPHCKFKPCCQPSLVMAFPSFEKLHFKTMLAQFGAICKFVLQSCQNEKMLTG